MDNLHSKPTRLFHAYAAYRLSGPLDLPAFNRAVNEIVRRHEVLRSVFPPAKGLLPQKRLFPVIRKFLSMKKFHGAMYRTGNVIFARSERMKL